MNLPTPQNGWKTKVLTALLAITLALSGWAFSDFERRLIAAESVIQTQASAMAEYRARIDSLCATTVRIETKVDQLLMRKNANP